MINQSCLSNEDSKKTQRRRFREFPSWGIRIFPYATVLNNKLLEDRSSSVWDLTLWNPSSGCGSVYPLIAFVVVVQSLSCIQIFATPWSAAGQASLSFTISEFAQIHVHRVSDAIQPSYPLSSPSPPAFDLSQHQGLFQWVNSSHQVAIVLEFQPQRQSFQWIFRTDFL